MEWAQSRCAAQCADAAAPCGCACVLERGLHTLGVERVQRAPRLLGRGRGDDVRGRLARQAALRKGAKPTGETPRDEHSITA
eukprot:1248315-Pleurochrysis_carterae.AAC.2